MTKKRIAVFGLGYVGLSNAVLLAQHNDVIAIDVNEERVERVQSHISPIVDKEITEYLSSNKLSLTATLNKELARTADYVIVATPTNYDEATHYFDTSSVQGVIDFINSPLKINPDSRLPLIIVKSTIPIGFIQSQYERGYTNVLFMPEFLREGKALYDDLHPSRIIVGEKSDRAKDVAKMFCEAAKDEDIPVIFTGSHEAEAIKLFANTYLAMRVAYINELDTFATARGFDTREILDGITLDPRIGKNYCNPSFGYGGYCLPKDTKQLLADFDGIPQNMISAIVQANTTRLDWIFSEVMKREPELVGLYRLVMKSGSDNFRFSAMLQLFERFKEAGVRLVIFEPSLTESQFEGVPVEKDIRKFKAAANLILANRIDSVLGDVASKVFTRDVYHIN